MNAEAYLEMLLQHMGVETTSITFEELPAEGDDDRPIIRVHIIVPEQEMGVAVGRRAETLIAIQRIILASNREEFEGKKVVVEVNDYRERRKESIENIVEEYTERVRASGRPTPLPLLSSEDRKAIHMLFKESEEFETRSEGFGSQRRLVLYPKGFITESDVEQDARQDFTNERSASEKLDTQPTDEQPQEFA